MPRLAMNYSNTIIYKIVCNDLTITECYVGHTTNFVKRKHQHKHSCNCISNQHYNSSKYQFVRNNGGWENWSMVEIEKYSCNDNREAEARERFWIEELKSSLNKHIPLRTQKQHYQDNKEVKLEYQKAYADQNRDKIIEYKKQYREQNRDKIREADRLRRLAKKVVA